MEVGTSFFCTSLISAQLELQPEICHVVHVLSVVIDVEDSLSQTINRLGSSQASMYELPTCPVCLERMDSAVTGLITVPCSHTFHCACLSKWGDSRYVSYNLFKYDPTSNLVIGAPSVAIPKHSYLPTLPHPPRHEQSHSQIPQDKINPRARPVPQPQTFGYVSSAATSVADGTARRTPKHTTKPPHIYTLWNSKLSVYGTTQATDMCTV